MVSHFLVFAFGGSFENLKTSGRMCLQGLGFSCRVWMVSHFLALASQTFAIRRAVRFEWLATFWFWPSPALQKNLRTHVPAGFRV